MVHDTELRSVVVVVPVSRVMIIDKSRFTITSTVSFKYIDTLSPVFCSYKSVLGYSYVEVKSCYVEGVQLAQYLYGS